MPNSKLILLTFRISSGITAEGISFPSNKIEANALPFPLRSTIIGTPLMVTVNCTKSISSGTNGLNEIFHSFSLSPNKLYNV